MSAESRKDRWELGHSYKTTRRKFELMRVDEIHRATHFVLREIDEAMALVGNPGESWEPDGECEIEITVRQRMKRKDKPEPEPEPEPERHPFYRDTPGAGY